MGRAPGPWKVEPGVGPSCRNIVDVNGYIRAIDVMPADAHFIASAPDMHAELTRIVQAGGHRPKCDCRTCELLARIDGPGG